VGSTKKKEVIICNLHIIFLEQLHINDSGSIRYASDNLKYGDHSGDIDIYICDDNIKKDLYKNDR